MIAPDLLSAYRKQRRPLFSPYNDRHQWPPIPASSALIQARYDVANNATRQVWDDANGYVCPMYDAKDDPEENTYGQGLVRIVEHPDEFCSDIDDLLGDSFTPRHNPDIKPEILERERQEQIARVERDGIWGYVAEFWDGSAWEHADSIWGFISDDFASSGYEPDLMQSALDALNAGQESAARELEATRPDMYEGIGI